jgi:hypothetical protein
MFTIFDKTLVVNNKFTENLVFVIDISTTMSEYFKDIIKLVKKFENKKVFVFNESAREILDIKELDEIKCKGKNNLGLVLELLKDLQGQEIHLFTDDIPCEGLGTMFHDLIYPTLLIEKFKNLKGEIHLIGPIFKDQKTVYNLIPNFKVIYTISSETLEFNFKAFEILEKQENSIEDKEIVRLYFKHKIADIDFLFLLPSKEEKEAKEEFEYEQEDDIIIIKSTKIQRIMYNVINFQGSRFNFLKRLQKGLYDRIILTKSNCHRTCFYKNEKYEKIKGKWVLSNSNDDNKKYEFINQTC